MRKKHEFDNGPRTQGQGHVDVTDMTGDHVLEVTCDKHGLT